MKGKLAIVLVMAVILSLLIVVPVSAKQPLRGWLDLDGNEGFQDEAAPCPDIPWAGNIEIDGVLYGWTWTAGAPPRTTGSAIHYPTSVWTIYESSFAYDGGVFEECGADIAVAVWGYNTGMEPGKGAGQGTVEWVNPDGPFDVTLTGRNMHVRGSRPSPNEYSGWFKIN